MTLDGNNLNNPELDQPLEQVTVPSETEEDIKKGEKSGAGIGSVLGLLFAVPFGIYSYINSPGRYSAEKLEKKADEHAKKQVRNAEKIAKKTKKTLSEEEHVTLYNNAQAEFHDNFVQGYRKRADQLAKNPNNTNKYLNEAIARADTRTNIEEYVRDYQKRADQLAKRPANKSTGEFLIKNLTPAAPTAETPSVRVPSDGTNIPSIPSVSSPSAPGIPGKTAPKIPGNKRGLPHIPRPGLPNPMQQLTNLLSPFNPTKIIMISLGGVFLATFLIVFLAGGGGGGGGVAAGAQPPPQTCGSAGGSCKASCDTNETENTTASCSLSSDPSLNKCCVPSQPTSTNVTSWAKQISDALTNTCVGGVIYNSLQTAITNGTYTIPAVPYPGGCNGTVTGTYFCTLLVRDAYKLAGLPGPTSSTVCYEIRQWNALPGYTVQTSNDVRNVKPGDAVFWFDSQINNYNTNICLGAPDVAEHTDIVYTLTITDSTNGLGTMQTLDANASLKIANYTIRNWHVVMGSPWTFGGIWFGLAP